MTSPYSAHETTPAHENRVTRGLESLASQTDPDKWQPALLAAFMESVGQNGMSPEVFEFLEKMYESAASTRQRNIEAATEVSPESAIATSALGAHAVNSREPIGGELQDEAIDESPHRPEREDEHERIVQEAIDSAVQIVVSGKFPNGVHVGPVNNTLGRLDVDVNGSDDYMSYSHNNYRAWAHKNPKTPYASIHRFRSEVLHTQDKQFAKVASSDFLIFRSGFSNQQTGQKFVQITFNRNPEHLTDSTGRGVYNIGVSIIVAEEEAARFQQQCQQGDRAAIDDFIAKAAPSLKELDGPKHDVFVASYSDLLPKIVEGQYSSVNENALREFLSGATKVPAPSQN